MAPIHRCSLYHASINFSKSIVALSIVARKYTNSRERRELKWGSVLLVRGDDSILRADGQIRHFVFQNILILIAKRAQRWSVSGQTNLVQNHLCLSVVPPCVRS